MPTPTDEELIEAYVTRDPRWESLLTSLGGVAMLGGCVISYFALNGPLHAGWAVLASVIGVGVFALLMACIERSPRRRALVERFFPHLETAVAEARESAGLVVILRARLRPHGGTRWVRLDLPTARVEAAAMGHRWEEDPRTHVVRRSAVLAAEAAEPLSTLARAFLADTTGAPVTQAIDGVPFDLAVVGEDGERRLDGNLAGVTAGQHAGLDLAQALLALSSRLLDRRSLTGSVDGLGNIVISEV